MSGQPITGSKYAHISANSAGANIKAGPGSLFSVCINTKGASSNVLTLFDSLTATGTVIAVIDTTAGLPLAPFYLDFLVGLSYSLATGTAADITISFS